jgi:hypothetical protein
MAEIPVYRRQTQIPSHQGSRIPLSAAGQFGNALAALGGKLAEIGKKKDESESLSQAQGILNETRLGVESDLDTLRRTGANSKQFQKDSLAVFKKWQDHAAERAKELKTPESATYLSQKLGEFSVTTQIALGDEFDKKFRDEARAGVLMQIPEIEARAIRADTPEKMQSAVNELRQFLGTHTGYALTTEEATKTYLESVDNVREQRVRDAIMADPVGGLNLLADSETAQDLKPAQVDRLTRFATAQINAAEAAERRKQAEETRQETLKRKTTEGALTRDVVRGRDITGHLIGPQGRDLDGPTIRALVDFQRSYRTARNEEPSDPAELLRWRVAARTGRDPETGRAIKWTDITKAPGLSSKDQGDLVDKLLDRDDRLTDKALTLRDRKRGRGENQIRLLLSGKDGLLAQITGSTGESFNDLNLYEALMEYDAVVEQRPGIDPVDLADEVATKYARNVITRFAGSSQKILQAYGVSSLDDLLNKAQTGEIPRAQADRILRLGQFLKKADPKPIVPGEGQDPVIEESRGYFDAVRDFFKGSGSGRSTTPTAPKPKQ